MGPEQPGTDLQPIPQDATAIVRSSDPAAPMTLKQVKGQVQLIQQVMREVMKKGEHYGVIPGTGDKPTLLKGGAEKLCLTFRLDPEYETIEQWDGEHLTIRTKCTLYNIVTGQRMGSGMGSCSTKESKYAYRNSGRKCPECGTEAIIKGKKDYGGGWICWDKKGGCGVKWNDGAEVIESQQPERVPNPDLADCYNTVLKMSNKRGLIAATLNVTAASDIFTQDLEDIPSQAAPQPPADAAPAEMKNPPQQGHRPTGARPKGGGRKKGTISEPQVKRLYAIAYNSGKSNDQVSDHLKEVYGLDSANDITRDIYEVICAWAEDGSGSGGGE